MGYQTYSDSADNAVAQWQGGAQSPQRPTVFYDWEHFCSVEELNEKLKAHLEWSNNKTMRTLGRESPIQLLREKLGALASTAP